VTYLARRLLSTIAQEGGAREVYFGWAELIFEVRKAEEGGYCARAIGHSIFTHGETLNELLANVEEAAALHFEEEPEPPSPVLKFVPESLL